MPSRDQPREATTVSMLVGGGRAVDLALMVFPHVEAAEHADAPVVDRAAVAGHYVDIDDHGDVIWRRKAQGALLADPRHVELVAAVADTPASSR